MSDQPVLRHVVLLQFKEGTSDQKIREMEEGFLALKGKFEEIQAFEWGTDVSVEGLSQGYTHCYLLTFASEADRDAYLPHPDHLALADLVTPHVEKVVVVDYWNRD